MKKILGTAIGVGVGSAIYDYLSRGEIDWQRAISIALIATVVLFIFEKRKEK